MQHFAIHRGVEPVILHAPHGGTHIPTVERELFKIEGTRMNEEILNMTDWFTEILAEESNLGGNVVTNHLSRLVFDPERFPDEREEMESVGMGFAYTHGYNRERIRTLKPGERQRIFETYYRPYTNAFSNLVNDVLTEHGRVSIIDIHSYSKNPLPYELNGESERPEICLGMDGVHFNANKLTEVVKRVERDFEVALNTPFSGSYVPLEHYGKNPAVSSLMIEIRRDVYMDEAYGTLNQSEFDSLVEMVKDIQTIMSSH